ncbi:sensor histidine kinase, partial [Bacteroidota bacterium]
QAALRERVKELSCLYSIAQVAGQHGIKLEQILKSIVEFLPTAWQYPEIAVGRIVLDGNIYSTSNLQKGWQKLTASIQIRNQQRGVVEVFYTKIKPKLDEGPFLKEERNLINVISRQIALIIETEEAEEEKHAVYQQLMHADRLATLGQLAAGVAHELNEPLGNILGLSQLITKNTELPPLILNDTQKIINATLYSRDIIKKMLLFAREMPPKVEKVNLNKIVKDGLFFVEARCAKSGIELMSNLSPESPEIFGDQSQLSQSLINLVVNSMQAMPNGGKLIIETNINDDSVSLVVSDTGIGMSEETKRKIFMPFFTTKDINEGTGLGLSVVHGIITSHKGTIHVESELGVGTRFEIQLPRFIYKS